MTTPDLMTPGQVAARFGVDPHTVTRWANAGRLPAVRTPGGHRRYRRADVEALATPGADLTETRPRPHLTETPDPTTTPTPTEPHHDVREEWAARLQCADVGVDFPWLTEDGCDVWHEQSEAAQEHYRNLLRVALSAGLQIPPPAAVSAAAPDEREALDVERLPERFRFSREVYGDVADDATRVLLALTDGGHADQPSDHLRWVSITAAQALAARPAPAVNAGLAAHECGQEVAGA